MTVVNRIRLYGVVLAALLVLFVLGTVFSPRRERSVGRVFPSLTEAPVEEVKIESGSTDMTLRRQGDGWVIDEGARQYPARSERVDSFLEEATESRLVRRVTGDEDLWEDFGLTESSGARLSLVYGDDAAGERMSVVWGADAAEAGLAYVRREDEPAVFASDGRLGFYLRQPATYWSYLRVLPEDLQPSGVVSISSSVSTTLADEEDLAAEYELIRTPLQSDGGAGTSEVWTAEGVDVSLDSEAVERLLPDLVNLVGRDFHRGAAVSRTAEVGSVALSFSDGREYRIVFYKSDDGFVCGAEGADLPGDPYGGLQYDLREATMRRLFPDITSLTVG